MNYSEIEVVKLTQQLVQIESSNVGTFEEEVGNFVYDWLVRETGLTVIKEEVEPGRNNIVACLPGEISHPNLVYIAHMDTVPILNGWTKKPLKAEIFDGKMYGVGAADMKCGVAAAMIAFREIVNECKLKGIKPKYDFVFIASVDEEGNKMAGASKAVTSGWAKKDSWILDTEPSNGEVMMAHKGKTWFEITTIGKSAHGSKPEDGVDAIAAMAEVIAEIRTRIEALPVDPDMGCSSVCFGTIKGGSNTNVVSDKCSITIDMRLAPPLTKEGSIKLVEEALACAETKINGISTSYEVVATRPFIQNNYNSFLLANLQESCKKILGKEAKIGFMTGYTDSGVIADETGCVDCMSFGATGYDYHQPDEYVLCDTIIDTLNVITDLAKRILLK